MIEQPEYERLLDREHESLRGDALLDAPVDAMAGITPENAQKLKAALGIETIRDLASNRHVLVAQRLAQAATHHPPPAPAGGASPSGVERLQHAVHHVHSQTLRESAGLRESLAALREQVAALGTRLRDAAELERRTHCELVALGERQQRLLEELRSVTHAGHGRGEVGLVLERLGGLEQGMQATRELTARIDRRTSDLLLHSPGSRRSI